LLLLVLTGAVFADDNPVWSRLDSYRSWVKSDDANRVLADHILTWQLPTGGFSKAMYEKAYTHDWNGTEPRSAWMEGSVPLGTIDNDATVNEILFLTTVWNRTGDERYRTAVVRAFEFLLALQYPSGGLAQVFPRRSVTYSNTVTFNDNAMVRARLLIDAARTNRAPFKPEFLPTDLKAKLDVAHDRAVDYILKSQIVSQGKKTVWCAQHDPVTYAPVAARAYELPSKSGSESVGVTFYLMTLSPTPEIDAAIRAALAWFRSTEIKGKAYNSKGPQMVVDNPSGVLWYRFYDLDQDVPFFCGRDGVKKYDIMQIEDERRFGYSWGGSYAKTLLEYAPTKGY